jgi:hypothetical protein
MFIIFLKTSRTEVNKIPQSLVKVFFTYCNQTHFPEGFFFLNQNEVCIT